MSRGDVRWTNPSVRRFAGNRDPVQAIVDRARDLTLRAMDEGWPGPPFDPSELAKWLNLDVIPCADIRDARIVPKPDLGLSIEFNPNRSRGRVRYSIAHEIAHSLFPDCAEAVRNRSDRDEQVGDEWQLEMLCNLAAAEILMPLGTLPDLGKRTLNIDELMDLRREFDVSTEALLLRYIRLTPQSCALIALSRQESGAYADRYRIDYAVPSSTWTEEIPSGSYSSDGGLVTECTAIGYTAKGTEPWPKLGSLHTECVGVPPYPGTTFPRVLALVSGDSSVTTSSTITYLHGDAAEPRGSSPTIIAHVVNDTSGTWGAGFARQLARRYSEAQIDFRRWCASGQNHSLGQTHFFGDPLHLQIASMVAQRGFGPSKLPRVSYPALEKCLGTVRDAAVSAGASVQMPRIGCGQAGGNWEIVSEVIDNQLARKGVQVIVYDLP
ncbi:MAG: ImmA/IrrE family metallo-endopeptidase [Phycisphaeraceae bacterium]|nr:ImmA/IrrE family metallo-endopeptidase [Phycisphaeraceae bacterium]